MSKDKMTVEFEIQYLGQKYGWRWLCKEFIDSLGGYKTSTAAKLGAYAYARKIAKSSGKEVKVRFYEKH